MVWINQSQIQEVITDSSLSCGTYIQIIRRFLFINPQVFQILPVLYMSKIILDIFHPLFWVISRSFFFLYLLSSSPPPSPLLHRFKIILGIFHLLFWIVSRSCFLVFILPSLLPPLTSDTITTTQWQFILVIKNNNCLSLPRRPFMIWLLLISILLFIPTPVHPVLLLAAQPFLSWVKCSLLWHSPLSPMFHKYFLY